MTIPLSISARMLLFIKFLKFKDQYLHFKVNGCKQVDQNIEGRTRCENRQTHASCETSMMYNPYDSRRVVYGAFMGLQGHNRYKTEGLKGLRDRPRFGRSAKVHSGSKMYGTIFHPWTDASACILQIDSCFSSNPLVIYTNQQ